MVDVLKNQTTDAVYDKLVSMGFNDEAIAVSLAIIFAESGFNPDIIGDEGRSYGIYQWLDSEAERKTDLLDSLESQNLASHSLDGQLNYFKDELTNKREYFPVLTAFMGETTLDRANRLMVGNYLRPADQKEKIPERLGFAEEYARLYNLNVSREGDNNMDQKNLGALNNISSLDNYGSLTPELLEAISGSPESAKQALALAQAMRPKVPEFDPAMASLLYFIEMGKQASQPGATVLGSAVGAMSSPAEYLMQQRKRKRDIEDQFPSTSIGLAKALKTSSAGSTTLGSYILQKDMPGLGVEGTEVTLPNANASKLLAEDPNSIIKKPTGSGPQADNVLVDVVLKGAVDDPLTPDIDERMIKIKRSDFDPNKHLPITAIDQSESQDTPSSQIAKLYDDLAKAEVGSAEYNAIEKAIRNLEKQSEFDKDIFEAENKVQADYSKKAKTFKNAEIAHSKLAASVSLKTGAGDLAIVFSFMKMLDEGSVVRESEFAQAQNTSGLLAQFEVLAGKIQDGTLLSDEQRQNFLTLSKKFLQSGRIHLAKIRLDKGIQVKNYNLNPVNIFGSEIAPPSFYLDETVFRKAKKANITPNDIWRKMTDTQKEKYLNPTT